MGAGMEEIFGITSALRYLDFGKHVAVITDARFSGVSTGACIGHVTPEALAGGPIGKVRDGDLIEIVIDRVKLEGSVNLVVRGQRGRRHARAGRATAARRPGARPGPARRDPPVGGAAGGQRRDLGRLRLRRGRDPKAAGKRLKRPARTAAFLSALCYLCALKVLALVFSASSSACSAPPRQVHRLRDPAHFALGSTFKFAGSVNRLSVRFLLICTESEYIS